MDWNLFPADGMAMDGAADLFCTMFCPMLIDGVADTGATLAVEWTGAGPCLTWLIALLACMVIGFNPVVTVNKDWPCGCRMPGAQHRQGIWLHMKMPMPRQTEPALRG